MQLGKTLVALVVFLALLGGGAAMAAEVVQGPCVKLDAGTNTLVLKDERSQKEITFDLSQAQVGMTPEPGDLIRVAYRMEGGRNLALKVMNLTKQDLRQK